MLKYHVRGENIEITKAIREYIESKISKLEKYFSNKLEANVYANAKVYKNGTQKIEITVPMKGVTLRAEETNSDLYSGAVFASVKKDISMLLFIFFTSLAKEISVLPLVNMSSIMRIEWDFAINSLYFSNIKKSS